MAATAAIAHRLGLPTPRVPLADVDAEVNLPVDAELDAFLRPDTAPLPADPLRRAADAAALEQAPPAEPSWTAWVSDLVATASVHLAILDLRARLLLAQGFINTIAPREGSQIEEYHRRRREQKERGEGADGADESSGRARA
jgi:hypothetical protein